MLYEKLKGYGESEYYGFHMPGHKRNTEFMGVELPYKIDITEIDGFDDLHHAEGILKAAQERAARIYEAEETRFLVNGSTAGILSAILGCTKKGDRILVARHCHKSVYHAMYLNELKPVYVYPKFDGMTNVNGEILKEEIKAQLALYPDTKAVVIVSPNYDGVVSDIEGIAEVVHAYDIPLIVDEAHGAHFGMHPYFPPRSGKCGADVVINSVHKTLPSLTQTALIHMNGDRISKKKICKYLDMLQTSSPSYVLMASIDACMEFLEKEGETAFARYVDQLKEVREELKKLRNLQIVETENYDRSKVVISVAGTTMTSRELYQILLDRYKLQMEMVAGTYVLAMTAVTDTKEGYARLIKALFEIDEQIEKKEAQGRVISLPRLEQVYTPFEVEEIKEKEETMICAWEDSIGKVATEYAYLYPPGSPLIAPGERISEEAVELLNWYQEQQFQIEGISEEGKIEVYCHA